MSKKNLAHLKYWCKPGPASSVEERSLRNNFELINQTLQKNWTQKAEFDSLDWAKGTSVFLIN